MNLRLVVEASMGVGLVFFILLTSQQMELRRVDQMAAQQTQTQVMRTLEAQANQATESVASFQATRAAYDTRLDSQAGTITELVAENTQFAQANAATATQIALDRTQVAETQTQVVQESAGTQTQMASDAAADQTQIAQNYNTRLRQNAATSTQAVLVAVATRSELEAQSTRNSQDAAATSTQSALILADMIATGTESAIQAQDTQSAFSTALVREVNATATLNARVMIQFEATSTRAAQDAYSTQVVAQSAADATQNALVATQTQQSITLGNLAAEMTEIIQVLEATPQPTMTPTPQPIREDTEPLARYANQGVEIYLPDDYINLNNEQDMASLQSVAEEMGDSYLPFIEAVQANPDLFVLYSVRNELNSDFTIDNMSIINEDILVNVPLADFLVLTYGELPDTVEVVAQEAIVVDGRNVGRTILRNYSSSQTVQQVQYVFQGDETEYWILTYTTGEQYFEERFPIFEASARTFRVLETP